ncbi:MAG: transglutaminase family protein [Cyanobacteriota bacterium]|nr:transglutaminase family protein [Cyanobacteriota bacterium]
MSTKIQLNHQLIYSYSRQVALGPHTLRLRPSPYSRTPIQSYNLKIEPQDHSLNWYQDNHGNLLGRLNFTQKTDKLIAEISLIAELKSINPFDFLIEGYASNYPFSYESRLAKELTPYLEVTESPKSLQKWVETNRQKAVYTTTFIGEINQKLAAEITHVIRLEPGVQTCEETLSKKIGSCRDSSWLLVQILRHYGLAARFVSGYLIQLKPDVPPLHGPPGVEEDTADLHAWAEVYLPGAGWIGLDPTSGFLTAEGHIPLAATAEPETASPLAGTTEPCESKLEYTLTVSRYEETAKAGKPYTEEQWQKIDALGDRVEAELQRMGVGLTQGGEPTFVSIDDFESMQWRFDALGEEKRKIARELLRRLEQKFCRGGGLLHYGLGKCYPGEIRPRWALGCYWREDGAAIWSDRSLIAEDDRDCGYTQNDAKVFMETLVKNLGVNPQCIIAPYEGETEEVGAYTIPLLQVLKPSLPGTGETPVLREVSRNRRTGVSPVPVALSVEAKRGSLRVFIPPISSGRSFVDLIAAIEKTAAETKMQVAIEGYPPPSNAGIKGFQISPEPGVIEVNLHPAANWEELKEITATLYEEARLCRLGTEKYMKDGRPLSTGGGDRITIGGKEVSESPLLRRPDLLRSLISYWQNHPGLSYLFSGMFVGATCQSPRVDEARQESSYELELALEYLQPGVEPEVVDRLLRHILTDVTGNTHRSAFCIDKLFPAGNYRRQLGLLEFRAFAMAPHPRMSLLQMLLIRALVAWFWEKPYTRDLIRWGTMLHDRFLLPHYIGEDVKAVIADLREAGFEFEFEWFAPFFEFRFPSYGRINKEGLELELRHAIEPWLVSGEEMTSSGNARTVDDSMERLQVTLRGAMGHSPNQDSFSSRYLVSCNGRQVPLKSTGVPGEYVGAVRYRARNYGDFEHPALEVHSPLLLEIVDSWTERSLGGCRYYVESPNGGASVRFPVNQREAESRMLERFVPMGHTPGKIELPPLRLSGEFPLTLDLRRRVLYSRQ